MKAIINFIKSHPIYFTGYGVTAVTYFGRYCHQMKELHDILGQVILAVFSAVVGLTSWFYVAARIINGLFN